MTPMSRRTEGPVINRKRVQRLDAVDGDWTSTSAPATLDYVFVGVTAEHEGFYGTVGGFAGDFSGNYGEVGYGFSAAELDFTISGIVNDSDLSGLLDGSGAPTPGVTLVFGVGKTFSMRRIRTR